ncbi:MAG: hypothetical protein SGILL_002618 [Bacillariaceae sp.]
MRIVIISALLALLSAEQRQLQVDAFAPHQTAARHIAPSIAATTAITTTLFAKSRKARRQDKKKQSLGRSKQFYEALEDAGADKGVDAAATALKEEAIDDEDTQQPVPTSQTAPPKRTPIPQDDPEAARRAEVAAQAEERYQERPEVSTMIVDEASGVEVLAQGQKVMDVVTRKAVKLQNGADARLAQMFPGVPPDTRKQYRMDWRTVTVPEMVEQLNAACLVKGSIPEAPSVASKAIEFVLANRDFMGYRMKKTLGRMTMHHATTGDMAAAKNSKLLWDNFLVLENHIAAPFRQILQDAEGRVGPNFGNLDLQSFCKGDLYERVGNYLVLKGMVAHWEKKVVDANFYENNPQPSEEYMEWLNTGDPKRYLADSPILWTLRECTQVCAKAQEMCQMFVQDESLFSDFPDEIVFLEEALRVRGGTALRKYMIDDFCPERGITPEALREGMRRFHAQLDNMQVDPYADLTNKVELLYKAMAIGTDDERDPYEKLLGIESLTDPSNPCYFETYTFNAPKSSFLRFMDNQYPDRDGFMVDIVGPQPTKPEEEEAAYAKNENPLGNLFGGGGDSGGGDSNPFSNLFGDMTGGGEKDLRSEPDMNDKAERYDPPELRAIGRRHELGWVEKLSQLDVKKSFGEIQPGRIIPDDEA